MARIGGTPPDIYNLQTVWTAGLVGSGALAAPPNQVTDFVDRDYLRETREAMTSNGRIWGIPAEVNVYLLVYNKKLFARAGVTRPPATWDELVRDAEKISVVNRQGQLTTAGFAFGPTPAQAVNPFLAQLYSNGETLFSADRRSTNLMSLAARQALEGQVALFRTRGTSEGSTPYQFPSGSIGMMIVPNWYKKQLVQALGQGFSEMVGVAPIPGGPNWKTVQYGFFWAVDANSPHAAEAWAFLNWLNSPREGGRRSCDGEMLMGLGALTGNKNDLAASAAELADPFMKPFADALSSGRALPELSIPHANEIEDLLRSYLEEAWLGVRSPYDALRDADTNIRMILEEPE
jgi:multiple sugar transport system substrate-binding protein